MVLVGVHKSNANAWKSYKFSKKTDLFIQKIAVQSKVVVNVFASPYAINSFLFVNNFDTILEILEHPNEWVSIKYLH